MQTSSVRYVQHHLAEILQAVESGAEIQITRRNQPVAMIVPINPPADSPPDWQAHLSDIKEIFNSRELTGRKMSEIVSDARGEN